MAISQSKTTDISADRGVIFDAAHIKSAIESGVRTVGAVLDKVVEYPGSRKGDSGRWYFVEWLDSKITGGGGPERR